MLTADCTFGHGMPIGRIDRTFGAGKLHGVAGPNGTGKSTLLLTLAGELEPVAGTVTVDGVDPASPEGAGAVVRVADPVFYPDLSVGEHLRLMGRGSGVDYDGMVATWVLHDLLDVPPAWLSSGQRQRVFLASQLSTSARVIVIDEPERHLDAGWVEFLCAELKSIARAGAVVVVASHSPVVLAACDGVVELG